MLQQVCQGSCQSQRRATGPSPSPTPPTPEPSPAPPRDEFTIRQTLTKVAKVGAGIAWGAAGAFVNAAAGGAQGVVHGAQLKDDTAKYTNLAMLGVNLLGSGAVGAIAAHMGHNAIAGAAALNLVQGFVSWSLESPQTRQRVADTADLWVDSVLGQVPGSKKDTPPGTPPSTPPGDPPGIGRRIVGGAVGEVVGFLAGTTVGATIFYREGSEWGERQFNRLADRFQ